MTIGAIFDMDGVLVLSENAHWLAWKNAAAKHGVELEYEVFLSCFGKVNADCIRIIFGEGVIGDDEAVRIADEKEQAYRDIVGSDVPLAPGLVDLLQGLTAEGARCAVGSSGPIENVDLVLDAGGIRQYFAAAVDISTVRNGKPAPDLFLRAAELIAVPPERCVVLEDAPFGIQAARSAGMTAVGITTSHEIEQLEEAGAHRVFDAMKDISSGAISELLAS